MITLILLPLLLQNLEATMGAICPERAVRVPEISIGGLWPSREFPAQYAMSRLQGTPLYWDNPGDFQADCCSSGRIVNWTITPTSPYRYIARINATCSNGEQISTPLHGYNGTSGTCSNSTDPSVDIFQPDNEGVFPIIYDTQFTIGFMDVGNSPFMAVHYPLVASCPIGSRAMGVGARSACYGLFETQVLCARTNDTQNNLIQSLESDGQCSTYTVPASNRTLVPTSLNSQDGLQHGSSLTDCCPRGEGIANWTVGVHVEGFPASLRGTCTDGTLLRVVTYGFNGTENPPCNQQAVEMVYRYNTPQSQQYYYSTLNVYTGSGVSGGTVALKSFMMPPNITSGSESTPVVCPSGLGAVGYSVSSSCYSLTNLSILCGEISNSSWAILEESGSEQANPPAQAEAGTCLGGISTVPDDTGVGYPNGPPPIGNTGIMRHPPIESSSLNPGVTVYTSSAGPLKFACCPRGSFIRAFNVWPTDNINLVVGKVSAVCSNSSSDAASSTNTSEIAYGFNGTSLNGTTLFCPNSTRSMKSISLGSGNNDTYGSWTYRATLTFDSLMEWPVRTEDNAYGEISTIATLRCPAGQQPLGFAARSACLCLADFKVICGQVGKLAGAPSPGIAPAPAQESQLGAAVASSTTGGLGLGLVGVVLAPVLVVALVAIAGFLLYKRHQNKEANRKNQGMNPNKVTADDLHSGGTVTTLAISSRSSLTSYGTTGTDDIIAVPFEHVVWGSDVVNMEDINLPEPGADSLSFESLPVKWKIPMSSVKLLCRGDKPIVLGKGGYGMVYKAIVRKGEAAIKIVTGGGKNEQARLLHEITILEQCKSVNIVQFLGYCLGEEGLLLCMEYMPGGTLYSSLRKGNEYQWYNRGRQAIRDIATGLYCLHEQNVAHLDLKTPNVLIAADRKVKIADMGLGKLVKGKDTQASQLGTIAWMAPEVLTKGTCALQSDVWSFSTILWEVCTLKRPEYALRVEDIVVPDEAPQELIDLIYDCRAQEYWERPSMEEICDRLDAIPYSNYRDS